MSSFISNIKLIIYGLFIRLQESGRNYDFVSEKKNKKKTTTTTTTWKHYTFKQISNFLSNFSLHQILQFFMDAVGVHINCIIKFGIDSTC